MGRRYGKKGKEEEETKKEKRGGSRSDEGTEMSFKKEKRKRESG